MLFGFWGKMVKLIFREIRFFIIVNGIFFFNKIDLGRFFVLGVDVFCLF